MLRKLIKNIHDNCLYNIILAIANLWRPKAHLARSFREPRRFREMRFSKTARERGEILQVGRLEALISRPWQQLLRIDINCVTEQTLRKAWSFFE
jgi:hypothetical protein